MPWFFLGHLTTRLKKDGTFKRLFGLFKAFFWTNINCPYGIPIHFSTLPPCFDWFLSFCRSAVPWCTFGFYSLFLWILDTKIFLNNLLKLSIPFYFVTFRCVPFCSVSFQANCAFISFCFIPLHFVPFRSVPFHFKRFWFVPFHSVPFRSVSFSILIRSVPFRSVPFCSVPFRSETIRISIRSVPFRSVPFLSVPFRFIIILNLILSVSFRFSSVPFQIWFFQLAVILAFWNGKERNGTERNESDSADLCSEL